MLLYTPGEIRTHDLRFRKPSLFPTELQGPNFLIIKNIHHLSMNRIKSATETQRQEEKQIGVTKSC